MKKKRSVHRFAHVVVPAKRKRNVAYPAAHTRARKLPFDPARRLDEINRVITMLLETRGDGQNVWIKDDIVRREINLLGHEIVGPRADVDFLVERVRLTVLIKSHHDDRRAISLNQSRVPEKFIFAV